jgi:drug/metabolite transporter (DMT)-like permease
MPTTDRILAAIGFRLASVLAFAMMGATIKLAEAHGAGLIELLFFRQIASLPIVLATVAIGPGLASLKTERIGVHVLRTAVGMTSMTFMFITLLLLPLAEATTLQFTVPIFATILGAVLLREMVGVHRWSAVLIGFAGVIVVTQPGSGHIPLLGAATGLLAAILSSLVSILLRQIGQTERPTTIVFYFALLSLVPLVPLFAWTATAHPPLTWGLLVLTGMIGGIGQITMTKSLALAPVSVVVPIDYSGLIWATLFGYLLFGALPPTSTWLGAPIIVASGLYIVWREHALARSNRLATAALDQ